MDESPKPTFTQTLPTPTYEYYHHTSTPTPAHNYFTPSLGEKPAATK